MEHLERRKARSNARGYRDYFKDGDEEEASSFRYSDSGSEYPVEEAPFITQKERLMWAVPKEELLNVSRHSGGNKVRLTTNPILEDLDPDIPYPATLGNYSTGVFMPDGDDIPIMMSDIREANPTETYEEITARVLERDRLRQHEMQASGGYGDRGGGYRGRGRGRG